MGKTNDDTAIVVEQVTSIFSKPLQEQAQVLSTLAFHYHKHVADAVSMTDATGISEGHGNSVGNTTSLTDTVSIYSQSYTVDMSYFADDYVGVIRTS